MLTSTTPIQQTAQLSQQAAQQVGSAIKNQTSTQQQQNQSHFQNGSNGADHHFHHQHSSLSPKMQCKSCFGDFCVDCIFNHPCFVGKQNEDQMIHQLTSYNLIQESMTLKSIRELQIRELRTLLQEAFDFEIEGYKKRNQKLRQKLVAKLSKNDNKGALKLIEKSFHSLRKDKFQKIKKLLLLCEGEEPELNIDSDPRPVISNSNKKSKDSSLFDRFDSQEMMDNDQMLNQLAIGDQVKQSGNHQGSLDTNINDQDFEEGEEEDQEEDDEADGEYIGHLGKNKLTDKNSIILNNKRRKGRKTAFRLTKIKGTSKNKKKTYGFGQLGRNSLSQQTPSNILNSLDQQQQKDIECRTTVNESQTNSNIKQEDHEEIKKPDLALPQYQFKEYNLDQCQSSQLLIYKSRLLLINLDQNFQVKNMYRLLKGDYFKCEQFALIKVLTETPRFFQIGWSKKFRIREILRLRITGQRDEHNLEEMEGDTCVVGKLRSSRLNYTFCVRQNQVYIIGGFDEYKRKFTKTIEVITASNEKGSPLKVTSDFPELKVGRINPSSIILCDRYLYVMFGKAKKGRGEMFQTDIEMLDLNKVNTAGAQFTSIKVQTNMSITIQYYNSLAMEYPTSMNEILLVGGVQGMKDLFGVPQCYKVSFNMQGNNNRGIAYIEKVKMTQHSSQSMDEFQSNMQNFMKIQNFNGPVPRTAIVNNQGTIFNMNQVEGGRMEFKVTDKIKNYIDQLTV
eukprot:403355081